MLRKFFDIIICLLVLLACGCGSNNSQDFDPPSANDNSYSENGEFAERIQIYEEPEENNEVSLSEYEFQLIEQCYGYLSKEEWEDLYDEVNQMSVEKFDTWIEAMESYLEEMDDQPAYMAYCTGGYSGRREGYGILAYSTSTNYSHLWTTNCYMWQWSQVRS